MPRREVPVTGYLKAIVAAVASLTLAACSGNELDHFYDDSLRLEMRMMDQHRELTRQWRAERDRIKNELGNDAPVPPFPGYPMPDAKIAARMRLMEQELLDLLRTGCPRADSDCRTGTLDRLGFTCLGSSPITCSLHNTAYGENHSIIKGSYEHHVWTIQIVSNAPNSAMTVRVELASAKR